MKHLNNGFGRRGTVLARLGVSNAGICRLMLAALSLSIVSASAQTTLFTGSTSANWSVPSNWSPAPPASLDNITIADSTPFNSLVLDDAPHMIGALTFGNSGLRTAAFTVDATLPGKSLTVSGGMTAAGILPSSATSLALEGAINVAGSQNWEIGGILAGPDKDQGVAITGPVSGIVAGALTVGGTLTKTGSGMLTLAGVSWGNGSMAVNSGALRLDAGLGKTLTVGGAGTSGQITIGDGAQLFFYKEASGDFGTLANPSVTKPFVLNGASNVELAAADAADVAVGSPLTFNGTHTVRLSSGISASSVTYRFPGNQSGAGTVSLATSGSGTRLLVFSGNNSAFTGTIVVGGRNVLRLASSTAGSAQALYQLAGGNTAIESDGTTEMVLGGLSGTLGTVRNGGATNTILRVGGADQDTTFAGAITNGGGAGSISMIKEGAGKLILSGIANNYTGPTSVDDGALVVSGAITASPISVNAGGTLGGSGSVTAITLGANGAISPGDTIGQLESLAATSLIWNSGSSPGMKFDLSSASNASDQLLISGAFVKGAGSGFTFDFLGGGLQGATYTLLTFGSSTGFSAADFAFTNLGAGLTGTFAVQPNAVTFSAIPEPRGGFICLAAAMFLGLRRRR
jgi:autotransporter-associated beta strand protein